MVWGNLIDLQIYKKLVETLPAVLHQSYFTKGNHNAPDI